MTPTSKAVETRLSARRLSLPREARAAVPFVVFTFACVVYVVSQRPTTLYYDAESYWGLAHTFTAGKPFSLYNFPSHMRGYLFPLAVFVLRHIAWRLHAEPMLGVLMFNALCMATLHMVLVPRLWRAMTGTTPREPAVWLAASAGFFLWRGYLLYPLTDLVALTSLAAAVVCLYGMREASSELRCIAYGAALAFLAAATGGLRPAYLPAAGAALGVGLLATRRRSGGTRLACAGATLLALLLVYGPQVALNRHHAQSWSPLPLTPAAVGRDLSLAQLQWGLTMQRYETNVAVGRVTGAVPFDEPVGRRLLASRSPASIDSMGQYVELMVRNPLDAVSIYARHLFNGCDLWYATAYIDDPRSIHVWTALTNVLLWMMTLLQCRRSCSWSAIARSNPYALLMLAPLITVIPAAVETRFFWPLHALANAVALFPLRNGRELIERLRENWLFVAACLCIWVTLSRLTYAHMML